MTFPFEKAKDKVNERGSALVYILIAIALLALLTVTFMQPSSQQTQSQNTFKLNSELKSQIDFIRSSVQECVMLYYQGDRNIPNAFGESEQGADIKYPIDPSSAYLAGSTLGSAANRNVEHLRCPGNPGDDVNHTPLFGGATGKFMPPAPDLFGAWQWYNGSDGAFYWIETDKSDAFIQTALTKLDEEFADCEADVIDTRGGSAENLTSHDTSIRCSADRLCFRVWMIQQATAVYPDGC